MSTDQFFQALESYWTPVPPGIQESFLGQTKEFIEIENRLKADLSLESYDQQIYPELCTVLGMPSNNESPTPRAVLHFCNNQLQLMENVFLALNLTRYHAHPLNRGWMNLFRRWTAAPTMRLLWPALKSLYSKGFVTFAEYQLNLSGIRIVPQVQSFSNYPDCLPQLFELRNPRGKLPLDPQTYLRLCGDHRPGFYKIFMELGQEWPATPMELGQHVSPMEMSSLEDYSMYFKPFSGSTYAWTVAYPDSENEMWGIALVASHPGSELLKRLMVWVRPAYRGVGLGTKLLEAVLEKPFQGPENMTDEQKHEREIKKTLIVLLPPLRRDKPGYADEMAGWLKFYGRKGFVRTTQKDAQQILARPFDPGAFCLVMPELLEKVRKEARKDDMSTRST